MATSPRRLSPVFGALVGAVVWILAALVAGGEPWDGGSWWLVPVSVFAAGWGAGRFTDVAGWPWWVAVAIGQVAALLVLSGPSALYLVGAALSFVFALPTLLGWALGRRAAGGTGATGQ